VRKLTCVCSCKESDKTDKFLLFGLLYVYSKIGSTTVDLSAFLFNLFEPDDHAQVIMFKCSVLIMRSSQPRSADNEVCKATKMTKFAITYRKRELVDLY